VIRGILFIPVHTGTALVSDQQPQQRLNPPGGGLSNHLNNKTVPKDHETIRHHDTPGY